MTTEPRTIRFSANGTVTVRQAPTRLLMKLPLQATGATLELGLTALRKQAGAAERWLQSLGAETILVSDPQFADTLSKDPLKKVQEMAARAMGRVKPAQQDAARTKTVTMILTAFWDINGKSAEQRLILLDRLQFEAASDIPTEEKEEEPAFHPERFNDPEKMQEMLAEMMTPKEEPRQAHFLFISRLSEESARQGQQEAFELAKRKAEALAASAGRSVGRLDSINFGHGSDHAAAVYNHMEQQANQAILAGTGYYPSEYEVVSERPTAAEFRLSVHVMFVSETEKEMP